MFTLREIWLKKRFSLVPKNIEPQDGKLAPPRWVGQDSSHALVAQNIEIPVSMLSVKGIIQRTACLTQGREVSRLVKSLRAGETLPPVIAYLEPGKCSLWLADGFHRVAAHQSLERGTIACEIRVGTRQDAKRAYAEIHKSQLDRGIAEWKTENAPQPSGQSSPRYRPSDVFRQIAAALPMAALIISFIFPPSIFAVSGAVAIDETRALPYHHRFATADNVGLSVLAAILSLIEPQAIADEKESQHHEDRNRGRDGNHDEDRDESRGGWQVSAQTPDGLVQTADGSAKISGALTFIGTPPEWMTRCKAKASCNLRDKAIEHGYSFAASIGGRDVGRIVTINPDLTYSYQATNLSTAPASAVFDIVMKSLPHRFEELLEKRRELNHKIIELSREHSHLEKEKHSHPRELKQVQAKIDAVKKKLAAVEALIAKKSEPVAETKLALLVGNQISAPAYMMSIQNEFKIELSSSVGTAIEGLTTKLTATITNLRKPDRDDDEHGRRHHEDNDDLSQKAVWLLTDSWLGKTVHTVGPIKIAAGTSTSLALSTDKLRPGNLNNYAVTLSEDIKVEANDDHDEKHKGEKADRDDNRGEEDEHRKDKITQFGALSLPVGVVAAIAPTIAAGFTPDAAHSCVKAPQAISVSISDALGFIDSATCKAQVSGNTTTGSAVFVDLSPILQTTLAGVGQSATFSGSISKLSDGTYTFTASCSNLAGQAVTNPISVNFIQNNEINLAFTSKAMYLTNKPAWDIAGLISDRCGKVTLSVTQNANSIFSGENPATSFDIPVTLVDGIDTFVATATDAAGNRATASLIATLDRIPPKVVSTDPLANALLNKKNVTVAITADKVLAAATIGGQGGTLSSDGKTAIAYLSFPVDGAQNIAYSLQDLAGNITSKTLSLSIDTTPPVLAISPSTGSTLSSLSIPVTISSNEKLSAATIGGATAILSADAMSAQGTFNAPGFGPATIPVTATDLAGNQATSSVSVTIVQPFALTNLMPTNGSTVMGPTFQASGMANRRLASISLNGQPLNIGPDGMSFFGMYNATGSGPTPLPGPTPQPSPSPGGVGIANVPECATAGTTCQPYTGQAQAPNCLIDGQTLFCVTNFTTTRVDLCNSKFASCAPYVKQTVKPNCLIDGPSYICIGTGPSVPVPCLAPGVACESFAGGPYPAGCSPISSTVLACGGPFAGAPAGVAPSDPLCYQNDPFYICPVAQPGAPTDPKTLSSSCVFDPTKTYIYCTVNNTPITAANAPKFAPPTGTQTIDCEFAPGTNICFSAAIGSTGTPAGTAGGTAGGTTGTTAGGTTTGPQPTICMQSGMFCVPYFVGPSPGLCSVTTDGQFWSCIAEPTSVCASTTAMCKPYSGGTVPTGCNLISASTMSCSSNIAGGSGGGTPTGGPGGSAGGPGTPYALTWAATDLTGDAISINSTINLVMPSGPSGGTPGTPPECSYPGIACQPFNGQSFSQNCIVTGSTLVCAIGGGTGTPPECGGPTVLCSAYAGQPPSPNCLVDGKTYVCFQGGVSSSSLTLTLASPGATVSGLTVAISGKANMPLSSILVSGGGPTLQNLQILSDQLSFSGSFTFVSYGLQPLTFFATGANGTQTQQVVLVSIAAPGPILTITSPLPNAIVYGNSVQISGTSNVPVSNVSVTNLNRGGQLAVSADGMSFSGVVPLNGQFGTSVPVTLSIFANTSTGSAGNAQVPITVINQAVNIANATFTLGRNNTLSINGSLPTPPLSLGSRDSITLGVGQFSQTLPISAFSQAPSSVQGGVVYSYPTPGTVANAITSLTIDTGNATYSASLVKWDSTPLPNHVPIRLIESSGAINSCAMLDLVVQNPSQWNFQSQPNSNLASCTLTTAPLLSPATIFNTESTNIKLTAHIPPNLAGSSVTIQRVDEHLNVVNGFSCHALDDGNGADDFANDGVYSCTVPVANLNAGLYHFAAFVNNQFMSPTRDLEVIVPWNDAAAQVQLDTIDSVNATFSQFTATLLANPTGIAPAIVALNSIPQVANVNVASDAREIEVELASGILISYPFGPYDSTNPTKGGSRVREHSRPDYHFNGISGPSSPANCPDGPTGFAPNLCASSDNLLQAGPNPATGKRVGIWNVMPFDFPITNAHAVLGPLFEKKTCPSFISKINYFEPTDVSTASVAPNNVDAESFQRLPNYDTIIIDTHGSQKFSGSVGFFSGELVPPKTASASSQTRVAWLESRQKQIGVTDRSLYIGKPRGSTAQFVGILPNYVLSLKQHFRPGTIVYMQSCESFGRLSGPGEKQYPGDSLANAFIEKGASVYLGYHNTVYASNAAQTGFTFFDLLLNNPHALSGQAGANYAYLKMVALGVNLTIGPGDPTSGPGVPELVLKGIGANIPAVDGSMIGSSVSPDYAGEPQFSFVPSSPTTLGYTPDPALAPPTFVFPQGNVNLGYPTNHLATNTTYSVPFAITNTGCAPGIPLFLDPNLTATLNAVPGAQGFVGIANYGLGTYNNWNTTGNMVSSAWQPLVSPSVFDINTSSLLNTTAATPNPPIVFAQGLVTNSSSAPPTGIAPNTTVTYRFPINYVRANADGSIPAEGPTGAAPAQMRIAILPGQYILGNDFTQYLAVSTGATQNAPGISINFTDVTGITDVSTSGNGPPANINVTDVYNTPYDWYPPYITQTSAGTFKNTSSWATLYWGALPLFALSGFGGPTGPGQTTAPIFLKTLLTSGSVPASLTGGPVLTVTLETLDRGVYRTSKATTNYTITTLATCDKLANPLGPSLNVNCYDGKPLGP